MSKFSDGPINITPCACWCRRHGRGVHEPCISSVVDSYPLSRGTASRYCRAKHDTGRDIVEGRNAVNARLDIGPVLKRDTIGASKREKHKFVIVGYNSVGSDCSAL